MNPSYPFPIEVAFSPAELAAQFGVLRNEQDPDPAFHYKLIIPLHWGAVELPYRPVTPEHAFELRSHCRAPSGSGEAAVKVFIAYVSEEISPSDWLMLYLDSCQEQTLHQRQIPSAGGAVPDVLTIGGALDQERISRWIVLKDHANVGGAHFFLLQASAAAKNYTAAVADVLFLAVKNFDVLHPSGWAYAEPLRRLVRVLPSPLIAVYPLSWQQAENPASNEYFYEAKFSKDYHGSPVGRISLVVAANQSEADMRRLEKENQVVFAAEGISFEAASFTASPPLGKLRTTLTATMRQSNTNPAEPTLERVVVIGQTSSSNWIYADRICPTRESQPESWAISRRAFEILLDHLEIH